MNFLRKMIVSMVVSSCILFGFWGICEAYEGIRKVGFGEYRKAIEIENKSIKFFDFEVISEK
jgi:hypothetical protein